MPSGAKKRRALKKKSFADQDCEIPPKVEEIPVSEGVKLVGENQNNGILKEGVKLVHSEDMQTNREGFVFGGSENVQSDGRLDKLVGSGNPETLLKTDSGCQNNDKFKHGPFLEVDVHLPSDGVDFVDHSVLEGGDELDSLKVGKVNEDAVDLEDVVIEVNSDVGGLTELRDDCIWFLNNLEEKIIAVEEGKLGGVSRVDWFGFLKSIKKKVCRAEEECAALRRVTDRLELLLSDCQG